MRCPLPTVPCPRTATPVPVPGVQPRPHSVKGPLGLGRSAEGRKRRASCPRRREAPLQADRAGASQAAASSGGSRPFLTAARRACRPLPPLPVPPSPGSRRRSFLSGLRTLRGCVLGSQPREAGVAGRKVTQPPQLWGKAFIFKKRVSRPRGGRRFVRELEELFAFRPGNSSLFQTCLDTYIPLNPGPFTY